MDEPGSQPQGGQQVETAIRGRFLPGLEGLRGVAVLLVFAFHLLHLRVLSGGFLGVDLFFVLSGFLITALLVEERYAEGAIGLLAFWLRRAKRLLPALFVLIAVLTVVVDLHAWSSGPRSDPLLNPSFFREQALAGIYFVSNWVFLFGRHGYEVPVTAHFWSLAVEEQFYLVWPIVTIGVFALARRHRRRAGIALSLLLAAASSIATWIVFSRTQYDSLVYLSTELHATGLLGGAALAWFVAGRPQPGPTARRWLSRASLAAAAGIAWMTVVGGSWHSKHFEAPWLNSWGWPLFVLLAVVVVADVRQVDPSPLARVLSWRPLRLLGLISYGLYIIHLVVIRVLTPERLHLGRWSAAAVQATVAVVLAALSYRFIEQPVRRSKLVDRKPWLVLVAFAGITAFVLVGTAPAVTGRSGYVPATSQPAPAAGGLLPGQGGVVGSLTDRGANTDLALLLAGDLTAQQLEGPLAKATEASGHGVKLVADSRGLAAALNAVAASRDTGLVVATCEAADLSGPNAAASPRARRADLEAVGRLLVGHPEDDLVLIGCPLVAPNLEGRDGPGQRAFNELAASAAATHPGRVAYLPVQSGLNLVGRYSRFLPPADQPTASFGSVPWEIVRMSDGVHYCPSGSVRVVAAALADLRGLGYNLGPSGRWWRGDWTTGSAFASPGTCTSG